MALFIGGRSDGRRMDLQDRHVKYVRLPIMKPIKVCERLDENEETLKMDVENYVRVYGDIYVHESLERVDLIKLLSAGYRNEGFK